MKLRWKAGIIAATIKIAVCYYKKSESKETPSPAVRAQVDDMMRDLEFR